MNPPVAVEVRPESPPDFPRRIVLSRGRIAGLALLLVVPCLALAGWLGDRRQQVEVRSGGVGLRADLPSGARSGHPIQIHLELSATSPSGGVVQLLIPAEYLERFSDVRLHPAPREIQGAGWRVVQEMPVGGGRAPVLLELSPERAGWARGVVRAEFSSGERVEMEWKTFIFP